MFFSIELFVKTDGLSDMSLMETQVGRYEYIDEGFSEVGRTTELNDNDVNIGQNEAIYNQGVQALRDGHESAVAPMVLSSSSSSTLSTPVKRGTETEEIIEALFRICLLISMGLSCSRLPYGG